MLIGTTKLGLQLVNYKSKSKSKSVIHRLFMLIYIAILQSNSDITQVKISAKSKENRW